MVMNGYVVGHSSDTNTHDRGEQWEELFKLSMDGVPTDQRKKALYEFHAYLKQTRSHFLGYQTHQYLDYEDDLSWMLEFHTNNVGDPFVNGNLRLNSKAVERHVLDYYAQLWHGQFPHDPAAAESYWGYLLTMGATEGNMYGLWNARDYLAGKKLLVEPTAGGRTQDLMWVQAKAPTGKENMYRPVAFFSEDTHYSFTKAVRVLAIPTFYELGTAEYPTECPLGGEWPTEVPSVNGSQGIGVIDVDKLATLVKFFAEKGHPILVSLNFGSTFKGAYDNVDEVIGKLTPIFRDNGLIDRKVEYGPGEFDVRHGFWIHVDGALGAAYMPFLKMAQDDPTSGWSGSEVVPTFDFSHPYVFSIAMSGHKWIGAPWPCGIYMTKVKYQITPPDDPQYIGSPDTTFAGSRNGMSPLVFWDFIAKHSAHDQMQMACTAQQTAQYAEDQLRKIKKDLRVARSPLSLAVRFLQPADKYVAKYSLSTEVFKDDPEHAYAHIYIMPNVKTGLIDELAADLAREDAYPEDAQSGDTLLAGSRQTTTTTAPVETIASRYDVHRLARVRSSGRGLL